MPIRRLSVQLANQIAAGEVVERPASVVKELLENAVDAHGTRIVCEVRGAGKLLIRVRDNGSGIPREELALALAPHATSKISSQEDLAAILTLGFRGEALASIAAVSKLKLISKPAEQEEACSVEVEGPEQDPKIYPAAHPDGTTVEVAELFFYTPARGRVVRADLTEAAGLREVFVRTALANPDLDFELISEGRTVLNVKSARGDPKLRLERIARLLGADYTTLAAEVKCDHPRLSLEGVLLPPPEEEESLPESIYVFLNGRPVADRVITHAVREAYAEVNPKRRTARCVLYLRCDPHEVDVNVHPRKDEVRFSEVRQVHDILVNALVEALGKAGFSAFTSADLGFEDTEDPGQEVKAGPESAINHAGADLAAGSLNSLAGRRAEPEKTPAPQRAAADQGADTPFNSAGGQEAPEASPGKTAAPQPAAAAAAPSGSTAPRTFGSGASGSSFMGHVPSGTADQSARLRAYQEKLAREKAAVRLNTRGSAEVSAPRELRFLALVRPNILLCRQDQRYFLLKGSALAAFDRAGTFNYQFRLHRVERQVLTLPFTLKADPELVRALQGADELWERCGFALSLKADLIELNAVPALLKNCDLASAALHALCCLAAGRDEIKAGLVPAALAWILADAGVCGILTDAEAGEICARRRHLLLPEDLPDYCCEEVDLGAMAVELGRRWAV